MGYKKHSGVEVEGVVVGRTSESGGHIRYPVKATITVHCADGKNKKGAAEYTFVEDPFGEMKADPFGGHGPGRCGERQIEWNTNPYRR